jgi:hypothetical protein
MSPPDSDRDNARRLLDLLDDVDDCPVDVDAALALTPEMVITFFAITRDKFSRRDLAQLLGLVTEMIQGCAEQDEPFREDGRYPAALPSR